MIKGPVSERGGSEVNLNFINSLLQLLTSIQAMSFGVTTSTTVDKIVDTQTSRSRDSRGSCSLIRPRVMDPGNVFVPNGAIQWSDKHMGSGASRLACSNPPLAREVLPFARYPSLGIDRQAIRKKLKGLKRFFQGARVPHASRPSPTSHSPIDMSQAHTSSHPLPGSRCSRSFRSSGRYQALSLQTRT